MTIGDKIYARRKELGLTLEEVGKAVGVGKSTVRKWETGYIENMKRDKIALLAQALGVSPFYIMGWDEDGSNIGLTFTAEKSLIDMINTEQYDSLDATNLLLSHPDYPYLAHLIYGYINPDHEKNIWNSLSLEEKEVVTKMGISKEQFVKHAIDTTLYQLLDSLKQ